MFIRIKKQKGKGGTPRYYASLVRADRKGGKVVQTTIAYLGRVEEDQIPFLKAAYAKKNPASSGTTRTRNRTSSRIEANPGREAWHSAPAVPSGGTRALAHVISIAFGRHLMPSAHPPYLHRPPTHSLYLSVCSDLPYPGGTTAWTCERFYWPTARASSSCYCSSMSPAHARRGKPRHVLSRMDPTLDHQPSNGDCGWLSFRIGSDIPSRH